MTGKMHSSYLSTKRPKIKSRKLSPNIFYMYVFVAKFLNIITSNTMSHLDKDNILFQNQYGNRGRVSCEKKLNTLNEKGQTDVIVVDFSKAFDKVDHQRLLLKPHRLSINN